ncbi:MAG TPA: ATP-binding cassette domain-containing protein, partial [Spirochaetia bacterium]|nr:ATP-binding cassette domain-containing protein [Spirochaetia bacterium]
NPSRAIAAGISLVPVDRRTEGVVLPLSVAQNIALATLGRRQRWGWVDRRAEREVVDDMITRLAVRTRSSATPVGFLSGGNQQKVALAKWLAAEPRLLLLDDPTRGVDIETRRDIYHRIRALASDGVGVLLSSTDTIELVGVCDRVLVMYEGRIVSDLEGDSITEENIVAAAVGLKGARNDGGSISSG